MKNKNISAPPTDVYSITSTVDGYMRRMLYFDGFCASRLKCCYMK